MRCTARGALQALRGLAALLLAVLIGAPLASLAQGTTAPQIPLVTLSDPSGTVDAEDLGLFWMDTQGKATLDEVLKGAPTRFQRLRDGLIHSPGDTGALWLHYRVLAPTESPRAWLLEFPIPVLDRATLYQRDSKGQWQTLSAGDNLAVDTWPERGRYPVFRLNLTPGQPSDLFVRIQHVTPISLPITFSSQSAHDQRIQVEYLGLGMAFGALILLITACAAQAWVYRDRAYAWYAVYAALMTLAVAAYTGVAGHMLWSGSGRWADASQGVLALLAAGGSLLFVRRLAGISARFRRLNIFVFWSGWMGLVLAVTYLLVPKSAGLVLVGGYVGYAAVTNMAVAWMAWRRGDVVGLWVLAAYVPLSLSVLLVVMRIFGLLPISFITQYAVVLGSTLEVPLLLVALSIRARERHGAEIRELAISSQDALTGLLASHLFHDRLRQVVSRFSRERQGAAIVLIDLVNYQRIKSGYGVAVAEQSLLRCVIKLRRLVRDVDTVSRVGEARFGLIMEGVSSRAVITDRAARLIAAGLMPLKGLKPDVTLQFHIAGALLSERTMDAPSLMEALDGVLRSMSPRTRRPIRFLEPERTEVMPLETLGAMDDDSDSQYPPTAGGAHPAQSNA